MITATYDQERQLVLTAPDSCCPRLPARPTRLGLVTRGKILAGAERQMLYLARGIDRALFAPHVITFFDGPVAAEARAAGVPVTIVHRRGRKLWQDPTMPVRLAAAFWHLRLDVAYAWLLEANVYSAAAAALKPGLRLVLSERGAANPRNRAAYLLMARVCSARASRIIANATAGADFVRGLGVPRDKVTVIPNGVPGSRVAAAPGGVADSYLAKRQQLALPGEAEVVFNAARLYAQKDHANLLRAFAVVAAQRPAAVLLVAGEGELRAELEALTRSLGIEGRVHWLGERNDIPALLAIARVAVLSSQDGEGLSNFLIEALLAGRRVVATDAGGTADVLAGTDGLLVPRRDHQALATALLRALEETDTDGQAQARRDSASARFGLEAYLRTTQRELLAAVGAGRA